MNRLTFTKKSPFFSKIISFLIIFNLAIPPQTILAQQVLTLPSPGAMVPLSPGFAPSILKGVKIFPDNPLRFDFIVDTGHTKLEGKALEEESSKLIKYFLASLTVPEKDLWVNLSPYEKDRIIPEAFGETEMGRDLLAQDYILKQLTASLIYPEDELGKKFWGTIYKLAQEKYGTTDIPMDTFNKVWIVPEKAVVYQNGDVAFVKESKLKVMMEQDYLASGVERRAYSVNNDAVRPPVPKGDEAGSTDDAQQNETRKLSTEIVREVILPTIEKEVNEGENFASLRQIYHSMILATWFKRYLKESFLGQNYAEQNKVAGVDVEDKNVKEKIYQQYLEAFQKGVYNYIKEEYDPETQEVIERKYFSGGATGFANNPEALTIEEVSDKALLGAAQEITGSSLQVSAYLQTVRENEAGVSPKKDGAALTFDNLPLELQKTFTITGVDSYLHTRPYRLIVDTLSHPSWQEGIEVYVTETGRKETLLLITGAKISGVSIAAYLAEGEKISFRIATEDPDKRLEMLKMMTALNVIFKEQRYLFDDRYSTQVEAEKVVKEVRGMAQETLLKEYSKEDLASLAENILFSPQTPEEETRLRNLKERLDAEFGAWDEGRASSLNRQEAGKLIDIFKEALDDEAISREELHRFFIHYVFLDPTHKGILSELHKRASTDEEAILNTISTLMRESEELDGMMPYYGFPVIDYLTPEDARRAGKNPDTVTTLEDVATKILVKHLLPEDSQELPFMLAFFKKFLSKSSSQREDLLAALKTTEEKAALISQWDFLHRFQNIFKIRLSRGISHKDPLSRASAGELLDLPYGYFFTYFPSYAESFMSFSHPLTGPISYLAVADVPVESLRYTSWANIYEEGYPTEPEVIAKDNITFQKTFSFNETDEMVENLAQWLEYKEEYNLKIVATGAVSEEEVRNIGRKINIGESFIKIIVKVQFERITGAGRMIGVAGVNAFNQMLERGFQQLGYTPQSVRRIQEVLTEAYAQRPEAVAGFLNSQFKEAEGPRDLSSLGEEGKKDLISSERQASLQLIKLLIGLDTRLNDNDMFIRKSAVEGLGSLYVMLVKQGREINLTALESMLYYDQSIAGVSAVKALGKVYLELVEQRKQINLTALELNLFNSNLRESAKEALEELYPKLVKQGKMSITDLKNRLKYNNFEVRALAVKALSKVYLELLKHGKKINLTVLENHLKDRSSNVRASTVVALGELYLELLEHEEEINITVLEPLLKDDAVDVSRSVMNALGRLYIKLVKQERMSITDLETRFKDEHIAIEKSAVDDLGGLYIELVNQGKMSITDLETRLKDDNPAMRKPAEKALGELYLELVKQGKMSIADLETFLSQYYPDLRESASKALEELYLELVNQGKMSVSDLEIRLKDDNSGVRKLVMKALGEAYLGLMKQGKEVDITNLETFLNHYDSDLRGSSLEALGGLYFELVKQDKMSITDLATRLKDNNPAVVRVLREVLLKLLKHGKKIDLTALDADLKDKYFGVSPYVKALAEAYLELLKEENIFNELLQRYETAKASYFELSRLSDEDFEGYFTASNPKQYIDLKRHELTRDFLDSYRDGRKQITFSKGEWGDGGNAQTNYPDFMRDLFGVLPPMVQQRPEGLPLKSVGGRYTLDISFPPGAPTNRYGRTLEYRRNGKAVLFKFLKEGEDLRLLEYEYNLMNFFRSHKEEWGLKGTYPEGKIRLGRIKVSDVPQDLLANLQGKEGNLELDKKGGFYTFMAYEVDVDDKGNHYYTYLHDPDISHEEFLKGLRINVHDRFVMAKHGLFDMEIIELFHNQEHGAGRRYDWMVDVRHHQQRRQGAGRLNNVTGATLYPNIRLSGPADLPGVAFIDDLIEDKRVRILADNRVARLLNMANRNKLKAHNYIQAALLGDTLLSLALIVPTYLDRRSELSYEGERDNKQTLLKEALRVIFEEAFKAFTGLDKLPQEVEKLNYDLMAKQMGYFMTDQYIGDLVSQRVPSSIFPGTELDYRRRGERGWSEKRGWDVTGVNYDIPSRNQELKIQRRSRDLGYVNGFNPLQELIKSMYVATTVMTAGKFAMPIPKNDLSVGEPRDRASLTIAPAQDVADAFTNIFDFHHKFHGASFITAHNTLAEIEKGLRYLLGMRQKAPYWLKGLAPLEKDEEFQELGEALRAKWKELGYDKIYGRLNQYLALIDGSYFTGVETYKTISKRVMHLIQSRDIDEHLLGLWARGLNAVFHIRFAQPHAERSSAQAPYELLDNDMLVEVVRQFIPLLIKRFGGSDEVPLSWKREGTRPLDFSYRELMYWALMAMLDPMLHNYFYKPLTGIGFEDARKEFKELWPQGQEMIQGYVSRMVTRLTTVDSLGNTVELEQEKVEQLLHEAFTMFLNQQSKDLRSPFDADIESVSLRKFILGINTGYGELTISRFPMQDIVFLSALSPQLVSEEYKIPYGHRNSQYVLGLPSYVFFARSSLSPSVAAQFQALPNFKELEKEYEEIIQESQRKGDKASLGDEDSQSVGGIDLNPAKLDLQTEGQPINFNAPVDLQNLKAIPFDGFTPVIIQIVPTNLPLLLGITEEEKKALELSSVGK